MNDNISRQKLYKAISDGDYTTGNIFKDMELQQFIKDQPPAECVPLSEVYRVIAGHSDYHGDNILAALTCIAAGKEVKPVRPLPADVPDTNVGKWIPCSEGTLPANGRTVPVTNEVSKGKRYMTTATYYVKKGVVDDYEWTGEGFYQYDSEYGYGRLHDVVAWLNVEPYKEP